MGIGDDRFRSGDRGTANPVLSETDRIFQQALAHQQAGRSREAETLYRQVLLTCPGHPDALRWLGWISLQAGKPATALPLFDKAIQGRPGFAEAYAARGTAFYHLQQYQSALESYDEAIRLEPRFAEAYSDRGIALFALGHDQAPTESCDPAIRLNPSSAKPGSNRGAALLLLQQHQAALASSNQAISLRVHYADVHISRGATLQKLGQYEAALDSYDTAIRLNPGIAEAWSNRANVLSQLKNYPVALESYDQALLLQPDRAYLPGMRVLTRLSICDWEGIESQCRQIEAGIERKERVADPFAVLSISGSAEVQRKAAEILARDLFPSRETAPFQRRPRRDKIRIGYFSADFRNHAMCSLMAEVFERHDRGRFEILAFSFGPDQTDEMSVRVSTAMDRFLRVRSMTDREVARLSRELEVDIAVDLMGFTDNCRTGIFAERASPIQVSYLGYLGTMGAPYIDYIIADHTVVPEASQRYYSEKIVYMPDCYQANDSRRVQSTTLYTRAAEGLPENGFVYCCFNSTFKVTPAGFDLWMRILREAEESVLWLVETNPWAADNLRKEAVRHGVSASRLVFAKGLPFAEYMTRQSLADLFLDTSPYNAGATASHALWAGLPVLTRMGEAFASRMAASLLRAIGLPELVTGSDADYVALAVELACNRERHREIREKLIRNRLTAPLFDVSGFCRHLESAYSAMHERYLTDLPPDHIYIDGGEEREKTLGAIALQAGQPAMALPLFDKAIQVRPGFAEAYVARGHALHHLQQYQLAVQSYDEAIRLDPRSAEAYNDRGVALFALGRYQADLESCDRAIRLKPDFAAAYSTRGAALLRLRQYQAAIENCDRAIRLDPCIAEPWSIRGGALLLLQQYQACLESSNQAIALRADYAEAHSNRGGALQGLGRYEAALESYDTAIRLKPSIAEAWSNRGNVLYRLKNYPVALESYDQALLLQPQSAYLPGMRVLNRLSICDWEGIESQCRQLEAGIERKETVAHPFAMLSISGSAEVQRKAAEILVRDQFPSRETAPFQRRPRRDKIRIGYFSADFHDHPMCSLMAEVFERHDRTRFEILAFSFGPDQTDEMSVRVLAAMDRVLHVRSMTDREVARLSRELEVDIAVDLMGFTDNCRTGIFAERASPVQVSYLGYVGTMGAPYIDYIIADHTVVPAASQRYYSEKIVYMPDCYQANDSRRVPSTTLYTRAAEGLPENGFVYCCFNSTFKVTPAAFDLWMRILREAEGSVLWLLETNLWATDNLRKEAVRQGVSPSRLVFAKAIPFAEYLTRQSLADLFLDTSPYNAGATASHALWAGLPVLTRMGEAFASRMAASLLNAIGLPELVTGSDTDYVALAVELACNRERHREIQEKLMRNRLTAPLFDVSGFCRHLESAYSAMHERYQTDVPPDHIHIAGRGEREQTRTGDDLILSTSDRILQQALAHHEAGRLVEAETLYRQVLQTRPDDPDALRLLGLIALQAGQPAMALPLFDKAIQGRPSFPDAYAARGDALYHLQQYQSAVQSYDEAIRLDPSFAEAYSCRGAALLRLQQYPAASESCDLAIRLNPGMAEPWSIRAAALLLLEQYQAALESSNQAIALRVDYADAHSNRGAALQGLGQYAAAVESYDTAIRLNPGLAEAWCSRGNVLYYRLKDYRGALASFDQAMLLQPDRAYLPGMRILSRLTICDWEGLESQCRQLEGGIERNEKVADPFVVLSVSGSADVQRKAAEILVRDQFPARSTAPFQRRPRRDKIRIGYFSADFHEHPMCSLMAEVFERHDRARFEILAFSFGPDQTDAMGVRVFAAMDRVLDVRSMHDREVARLSRELEVDIAVDLMGFSDNCRTGIFAERASPIQVSYLGYVGSMSAPYIDYIIADPTVIPGATQQYYSEKIVYMPDCYQANDTRRMPSARLYTRAAEGLPENGFVYCCFNNTFKIAPATFDLWMRILREADGSVLWLFESNPWAADNLRKEALRRGVSPNRLVFAKGLPFAEYVTRQSLADLFLDTGPYNGGATASHALWAGLPVLTRMGEAFASRMAASLLRAIGLPELVTSSDAEYVALAVELACTRERHREIREKLKRNRLTAPLFDVSGFCRHLESGYGAMYERYERDLPPDHIHIQRCPE